ncbi:MAG: sensor histidine kinase KdpD [Methylovirgula sp.]|jgi:two-component system sensor histidine kinase KdpD
MSDEQSDRDNRPSPEALLAQAAGEGRGRLKVFLGAAPGVGKTFEMLMTAQAKRRAGVDVVVGVVETHGRKETQALVEGLEVIPRRRIEYRGHVLEEMDIDAILQRRPKLVLVDELAHTNALGSRHPKRYLDVEELLAAGIDVFTTLNIQHLESLNDVVAKITRIWVRETVPDSVIDNANDVEVVDLTPDDLIQRLNEGKVYVPHQAQRAVKHYFQPGNLTALRELALRRTAQRVDQQMVTYMRAHAIPGPWAAGERVLVCINENPSSINLVRSARRLADRLHAPWTAIHIETSRTLRLSEADRTAIAETMRLAERLGGETVTIPGHDVARTLVDYATENNVTHVVISRSRRGGWRDWFGASVMQQIIQRSGGINVHIIAKPEVQKGGAEKAGEAATGATDERLNIGPYVGGLVFVAIALGVGEVLQHFLASSNISLVFLTAVMGVAIAYGLYPALLACLVSVLAYNFFFLPPLYSFTIADPENVVALFFFGLVAVIASNLTARMRNEALNARQRARTTEDLYLFARKLAGAISLDDLLWATVYHIALMLKVRVVLLLPRDGVLTVCAGYPPEDTLDESDIAAAKWSWEHNRPAGRSADTLPGAKRLFLPIRTARSAVAVVGLDNDRPGPLLTPDQTRLLDALSDQAALAIERVNLVADVERARIAVETERLRSALLTSISHDLRTPLASILGAATSLKSYGGVLDQEAKDELVNTIQEESERLNRFIGNLLDMTRLEAGAVEPQGEMVDLGDVVGSALGRASKFLADHLIEVDLDPNLPLVKVDPVLLEQVLFNLLDNAAKYTPTDTKVTVRARREGQFVRLDIMDEGQGIPEADKEKIFDKFYRIQAADRKRAGTGLGLAIGRGFIEAMGGAIVAGNRTDRSGAIFTIKLPSSATPADEAPR